VQLGTGTEIGTSVGEQIMRTDATDEILTNLYKTNNSRTMYKQICIPILATTT